MPKFSRLKSKFQPLKITHIILFLALLSTALVTNTQAEESYKYILVNGSPEAIVLKEQSVTHYGIDPGTSKFYRFTLRSFPHSRGNLAKIDGQWQGILIHNHSIYTLNSVADSEADLSQNPATARRYQNGFPVGSCGAQPANQKFEPAYAKSLTMADMVPKKTQIDFTNYCISNVDGVCLVAELNVIFDIEFELTFGSNFQAQAIAILENVSAIYQDNFNIRFNAIRLGFQDDDLITQSENIEDVYNDMGSKRLSNQLTSIDPNPYALFHFISGRDYLNNSSGTVGIAAFPNYSTYPNSVTPLVCTPIAIGTSQVLGSGSNRAALTALVVAHELGHNFGFDHDGESGSYAEGCASSTNVMGAFINGDEDRFSTCSSEALTGNINNITNIERCFLYPVDGIITANNPSELAVPGAFDMTYQVTLEGIASTNPAMTITGNITQGEAQFTSASLGGSPCSLSNSNTRYQCTLSALNTPTSVAVNVDSPSDDVEITTAGTFGADFYETNANDNSVQESIRFVGPGLAPDQLAANTRFDQIELTWVDRATDETGYLVERSADGSNWSLLTDELASNTRSYSDTSVSSNAQYFYRVGAIFSDNSVLRSNEIRAATGAQPKFTQATRSGGAFSSWFYIGLATLLFFRIRYQRN